ncbi:MAG: YceI family protein [Lacibacter sp.]|jgi:polyisoprenoid-binding protein YceI|nr:YceI family protein [Lacibacter sp.]
MRTVSFILIAFFSLLKLQAQENYMTRNGQISFFSSTPLEDIKAINNEVASVINRKSGSVQFIVLIKSFQFRKTAMQDHFNGKDYMNSDRYPKAELKGTITNISTIDFTKDGTYPVTVEGLLSMHGVSNKIKVAGNILIKGSNTSVTSVFTIKLVDYKISVPTIVSKKIAEKVEVTLNCSYQLYQPKIK